MPALDLGAAERLWWGGTEVGQLYRGGTLLWSKPAGNIAFPSALFDVGGICYDPYGAQHQTAASASDLTGSLADDPDEPVALIERNGHNTDYGGTARAAHLYTTDTTKRPLLKRQAGRRCLKFDGGNDLLEAVWADDLSATGAITLCAQVYADLDTAGTFLCLSRAEQSASLVRLLIGPGDGAFTIACSHRSTTWCNRTFGAIGATGRWFTVIAELTWTAWASEGGHVKVQLDGSTALDAALTPTLGSGTSAAVWTRVCAGARRSGGTLDGFFNGHLGRFGFLDRVLSAGEKDVMRQWLQGTALVAP